ncbi:hypothetical protein PUN28_008027 [Cardiocondyla obscurior]|uniref:Uncharacterized protein n=1 Tax=Cardiocondyla obscurior TaxID=286306 RepID=A0AAW2FXW4_9HYME
MTLEHKASRNGERHFYEFSTPPLFVIVRLFVARYSRGTNDRASVRLPFWQRKITVPRKSRHRTRYPANKRSRDSDEKEKQRKRENERESRFRALAKKALL